MRRVTLYISEPQYQQFQELAATRGQAYSELIREALNRYLRAQARTDRKRASTRKRS